MRNNTQHGMDKEHQDKISQGKIIICQNCGKVILTIGEDIRVVVQSIAYSCKCKSNGHIETMISDFNKEDVFIKRV